MGRASVETRGRDGKRQTGRALARLATEQYGVVAARQLRALGISDDAIRHRRREGRLHRIHRGVYAVGHRDLSSRSLFVAAVLAVGDGAVLSHRAAAALWDFMPWDIAETPDQIDVTVARDLHQRAGQLRIHPVRNLPTAHTTLRHRIPVTTPARTLLDLAATLPSERQLLRALHEAQVQRRTSIPQLHDVLDQLPSRRPGVKRLRALIAEGPTRTRSELEDRALELLQSHGLPPPQTNVRVPAAPHLGEVDLYYPGKRLVIELDGARFHDTPQRQASDRRKQAALEAVGERVMRLGWQDIAETPDQTVARVLSALAD